MSFSLFIWANEVLRNVEDLGNQRDLEPKGIAGRKCILDIISCESYFTRGQWVLWERQKWPLKYEPRFPSLARWRSGWSFLQPFPFASSSSGLTSSSSFPVLRLKPRALGNKACASVPSHIPKHGSLPHGITAALLKTFAPDSPLLPISHRAAMAVSLAKQVHC